MNRDTSTAAEDCAPVIDKARRRDDRTTGPAGGEDGAAPALRPRHPATSIGERQVSATQRVIVIVDSERLCSQCSDTGLHSYPNERGGTTSERCAYCLSAERKWGKPA